MVQTFLEVESTNQVLSFLFFNFSSKLFFFFPNKGMNIDMDENDEISLVGCGRWCRERFFTFEKLKRRFPIVSWLPKYTFKDLKGDIIAGISVAFTIVPQGLALALLAGLPAHYGLYTSFIGCFAYAIFGTCKDVSVGPTSILAILIAPYVAIGGVDYAIILSFLIGFLMLILGILNLGFVVDFVSFPVISSFSSAAAISIAVAQLKGFFGLHYEATQFFSNLTGLFSQIDQINFYDTILGFFCLLFLLPLQHFKDFNLPNDTKTRIILNKIWKITVTSRNAIIVLTCSLIENKTHLFSVNQNIRFGLPPFALPPFETQFNGTVKKPTDILNDLIPGVFIITMVGLLETVAVSKVFMANKKYDATQDMIALGLCNIAGSFFFAFPAVGSFSRSAVNHNSGVCTLLGGILTGTLVILSLLILAPYLESIPITTLSSIIIAAVLPMIKFDDIQTIFKANLIDAFSYFITLSACLIISLEYGICFGIIFSLLILLYQIARPRITIVSRMTTTGDSFMYIKPDRSILFPSVEYVKVKITKALASSDPRSNVVAIVIDGEHMFRADSTFAMVSNLISSLNLIKFIT